SSSASTVSPVARVTDDPNTPTSVGARLTASWHMAHPICWKRCAPAAAMGSTSRLLLSHSWYCVGGRAMTWPRMREWLVPQYSAQNKWYTPGLLASNHIVVYRPGTTSILIRNAGTHET